MPPKKQGAAKPKKQTAAHRKLQSPAWGEWDTFSYRFDEGCGIGVGHDKHSAGDFRAAGTMTEAKQLNKKLNGIAKLLTRVEAKHKKLKSKPGGNNYQSMAVGRNRNARSKYD